MVWKTPARQCVYSASGLGRTPWYSSQDLRDQQHLDVGRSEKDGDDSRQEHKARHDGVPVPKSLGDVSVDCELARFNTVK
jgi:hypothetical protein